MKICCIIKPEALSHRSEIIDLVNQRGIKVLTEKKVQYSREIVEVLYDHMDPSTRRTISELFNDKEGIALLVEAPSAEEMLSIAGTHSDPSQCAADSIRARYGIKSEPDILGMDYWWQNAFHRPIDMREAKRDVALFFP